MPTKPLAPIADCFWCGPVAEPTEAQRSYHARHAQPWICLNPDHDHTSVLDRDGGQLDEPIPSVCSHCGCWLHYDRTVEDWRHSDPAAPPCFLVSGHGPDGTPCTPLPALHQPCTEPLCRDGILDLQHPAVCGTCVGSGRVPTAAGVQVLEFLTLAKRWKHRWVR